MKKTGNQTTEKKSDEGVRERIRHDGIPSPSVESESVTEKTDGQEDKAGSEVVAAESLPVESDDEQRITLVEAERLQKEAYLRGRNEAIASALHSHGTAGGRNLTPGLSGEALPSDPQIARLFNIRPSVWE